MCSCLLESFCLVNLSNYNAYTVAWSGATKGLCSIVGHTGLRDDVIKDDLPWLYRQLCGYASMPDPAEDVDAWHLLIQQQYIRWHQKSDSARHMTETCPYTRSTVPPKSFAPHASPWCPDPGRGRHHRSSASVALIACL